MGSFSAGWHSYSFKSMLRSRFGSKEAMPEGKPSRPPLATTPPNASFHEGVATKDISINDDTGLTVRIFLPSCCIKPGKINEFGWMMTRLGANDEWIPRLLSPEKRPKPIAAPAPPSNGNSSPRIISSTTSASSTGSAGAGANPTPLDASGVSHGERTAENSTETSNEEFWQGLNGATESAEGNGGEAGSSQPDVTVTPREYTGYIPKRASPHNHRLPVIVQFHGGGFVTGSKDEACNDTLCRRLAKVCNSIVIAVGYRLAPENKCPAPYDDGYDVLKWLSRQTILGEVEVDMQQSAEEQYQHHQQQQHQKQQQQQQQQQEQQLQQLVKSELGGGEDGEGGEGEGGLAKDVSEGAAISRDEDSMSGAVNLGLLQEVADPWIAVHADVTRCLVLGVSSGGNVADQVTRRACTPQGVNDLAPCEVAGQVLLYPLFGGSMRTPSETKSRDAYFFDPSTCELVFRLFLEEEHFSMDHPAVNPMLREQLPPGMPPSLLVVADHDMLTDRAIAYSVFLRNYGVDVQVNSYKDVVHGFASHASMVHTPQAEACVEDIAMWVAKHVSPKDSPSELSY